MTTSPGDDGTCAAPGHIAVFLSPVGLFGRERLLLAVAERLGQRGHRVDVLMPGAPEDVRRALPENTRLIDLGRAWMGAGGRHSKRRVYLSLPLVAAYLRRTKPDVLLSGSIPPNIVALLARRLAGVTLRVVLRQSNVIGRPGDPDYGGVRPRPRDRLVRLLFRRADAVIAVSKGVADNVHRVAGVPHARIRSILAAVDLGRLNEMAGAPCPHPWLADAGPVVLTVGRMVAKKDHVTLLKAMAELRRSRDVRLLLVGDDGEARPDVEAEIARLGLGDSVALTGHSPNPYAFMARAQVFVLSSVSEGMPNVLLEALACGCPVVSTDCPSGPRELLEGGAFGRLVPMRDPAALAAAIAATLDAPPEPDRLRTRAAAFGISSIADAYVEVVESQLPSAPAE